MAVDYTNGKGYNEGEVNACVNGVKASYNDLYKAIVTDVKRSFIDVMGNNWYTDEAVNYFQNYFKVNFENLMKAINDTFVKAVEIIEKAAEEFAHDGDCEYNSKGIETNAVTCNVDNIKSIDERGSRGINPGPCKDAISTLTGTIKNSCDSAISKAVTASQNNGFCDQSERNELYRSFKTIKNSVNDAFKEVSEEAKKTINEVIEKYKNTSSSNKSSFSIK